MTLLINLREMGELHSWITHEDKRRDNRLPGQVLEISKKEPNAKMKAYHWLEVGLPALSGPYQNRP